MSVTDYLNLISSTLTWSETVPSETQSSSSPLPLPAPSSPPSTLTSPLASPLVGKLAPTLSSPIAASNSSHSNASLIHYILNYHNEALITYNSSILLSNSTALNPLPLSPSMSSVNSTTTVSPSSASVISPSSIHYSLSLTPSSITSASSFLDGLYNDSTVSEASSYYLLDPLNNSATNNTTTLITGIGTTTSSSLLYDTLTNDDASYRSLIFTLLTSITLGTLILSTIIGNLFVMVAIWIDRNLQNIQNYLVASLAAADFMVACLVMPLGALYEVQGEWSLGSLLCDIWTFVDVLCCTASILHLVAIALDRYWAVNSVTYMHSRSPTKICSIILSVWSVAIIVSIGPILGWKDPDYERRVTIEKRCLISQHMGYQIFATISTFYGPLMVILFLYWRIYKIARRRVKNRPGNKSVVHVKADESIRNASNGKPLALVETEYQLRTGGNNNNINIMKPIIIEESRYSRSDENENSSLERGCEGANGSGNSEAGGIGGDNSHSSFNIAAQVPSCDNNNKKQQGATTVLGLEKALRLRPKKDSANSKREGKTAKILAIITGIFIVCWLPFFVHALVTALCGEVCEAAPPLYSIFLWLGYANSLLNPVIYTIFSRDFRNAFRRILFGANPNRM